ncbi:MAG: hypothetical protein IMZ64_13010 [Bacteroidetes bacterium]|nr:hypothetical protein [Bacteroidota bacterium]
MRKHATHGIPKMKEKNRIIESCDTIEKALKTINDEAVKKEFTLEEWISFNDITNYTRDKYLKIRKYAKRTIP